MTYQNSKRILVVGAGSIGLRHLKNLKTLGIKELGVLDLDKKKLDALEYLLCHSEAKPKNLPKRSFAPWAQDDKCFGQNDGFRKFSNLKDALKEKWSAVFIATPPSTHVAIALKIAKRKIPMFIEKPLSHNLQGVKELAAKAKNIKPVMVGYNIDFHPQFGKIKQILTKKTLGKIWGARAEFGQYLPDWRPKQDYSKTYSAKKSLGGGILLDDIHEINSLYNLFGNVKKVFGLVEKVSDLKIETEDYVELILWFASGVIGQIHMDYLQRDYSRCLKIIGEKGTLIWTLKEAKIDLYSVASGKWKTIDKINNFDWNTTYLEETKEFLRCLKEKKNPQSDLSRGLETLKIAMAVKESSKKGKAISVQ